MSLRIWESKRAPYNLSERAWTQKLKEIARKKEERYAKIANLRVILSLFYLKVLDW